jgi:hypothetical protein
VGAAKDGPVIAEIARASVLAAAGEIRRAGRGFALAYYGYGSSTEYDAVIDGDLVPAKAVVGLAHRYQHGGAPLHPSTFSGGVEHSAGLLLRLGFEVRRAGELVTEDSIPLRLAVRPVAAELRLYACRPTNARSVAACYEHDFGSLLSPLSARVVSKKGEPKRFKLDDMSGHTEPLGDLPYVLDNGVWPCHVSGEAWQERPFMQLLERLGPGSTFSVLPDIVGAGEASLASSLGWWRQHRSGAARGVSNWMLAVQDGMTVDRVRDVVLEHGFGIFVGGSAGPDTPNWKWTTVDQWAQLGLDLGVRVHVGRVNGERKAALCRDLGVTSIDGSCVSRYAVNATKMGRSSDGTEVVGPTAAKQLSLGMRP